jgi:serine protease AprX
MSIARVTGARALWGRGYTGKGIDVALIDTGITPVTGAPSIAAGADLSLDAANPNLRFLDGFGHGTHMAGIIGGHDASVVRPQDAKNAFVGIAPGSRIVDVKVGAMDGTVHVSQVIAGLDWVVQNRYSNGMNIRVVNLSYGAPATPNWRFDPLAWAAEVAWRRGIVVMAAAGNEGPNHELASPAYSPNILAVGATEIETQRGGRNDYAIASFTSTGNRRRPDLYVPGSHVISLRVKGSFIDTFLAQSNISDQLTRGTGTSQATAVASGLAALLLEAFPSATPDQIKAILTSGPDKEHGKRDATGIETSIDVNDAVTSRRNLPNIVPTDPFKDCGPTWCRGAGDGSPALVSWAQAAWNGTAWLGNQWTGNQWTGNQWTGSQWTGNQWTGNQWTGSQWTGNQWTGLLWNGSQWTGSQWTGSQWTGSQWTGSQWTGSQWTGSQWTGSQWTGSQWTGSAWSSLWSQ